MTIHGGRGAPMVYGVEAFEYEARPDGVVPRRNCCLLARASAVEGRIRSEYEAAGERGRSYEALEGSVVPQTSVGALERPAVGTLLIIAVFTNRRRRERYWPAVEDRA